MFNLTNNKGISPIVATALLLIVAVLVVVNFQSWFMAYQSSVNAKVEQEGSMSSIIQVETITGGTIYLKGSGKIQSVNIGGRDCLVSGLTDVGVNSLPMADCAISGVNDVVVVTTKGVFNAKIILDDYNYSAPCPTGFIMVQGNIDLGTKNFCVMKYEAKNVGGIPNSTAVGTPWKSITWQNAKLECGSLGSGYHLITDDEWITIAKIIEKDPTNWDSSVVGVGGVYRGNINLNDGLSCGSDIDLDGNTAGVNCMVGSRNKRSLNVSGNLIWDFSGNVREWTDEFVYANSSLGSPYRYHGGNSGWMSYNTNDGWPIATNVPILKRPSNNWNANNGMGRYHDGTEISGGYNLISESPDNCVGFCSPKVVFLRGGCWDCNTGSGIFGLILIDGLSRMDSRDGFRCSYTK